MTEFGWVGGTRTRTEVRSPTSTRTEVRSPTSTSTRALTRGNRTSTSTDGSYNTTNNYAAGSRSIGFDAHPAVRAHACDAFRRHVARQRFTIGKVGPSTTRAKLSITLPDGSVFTFISDADTDVLLAHALRNLRRGGVVSGFEGRDRPGYNKERYAFMAQWKSGAYDGVKHKSYSGAAFDAHIIALRKKYGVHRTGGVMNDIMGGVESAGRDIAQSGVLKMASSAMMMLGPILPQPIGAAALAVGATLKGVRALTAAKKHKKAGDNDAAQDLVNFAAKTIPIPAMRAAARGQADKIETITRRAVAPTMRTFAPRAVAPARSSSSAPNLASQVYAMILRPV